MFEQFIAPPRLRQLAAAACLGLVAVTALLRFTEHARDQVKWLEARLAERRDVNMRLRREMAEVAGAVERLARTAAVVRERATEARRLAHMEESHAPSADVVTIAATFDGGTAIVSEDAARALEQLAWLDTQTAAAGSSIAVLTALLNTHDQERRSVPSLWPVRGRVTSRFGRRSSPYGEGLERHLGIDIRARKGLPVAASGDAHVLFAGRDPGYGGLVILRHGAGIDTLYGHLSATYVRAGQKVLRGEPIGAVGATGRATGAHLHYEVRVKGEPIDPRKYLGN